MINLRPRAYRIEARIGGRWEPDGTTYTTKARALDRAAMLSAMRPKTIYRVVRVRGKK